MTDTALPPLPLGASDFETLRARGQIYVDKTELIFQLASRAEKFFLTRPRRFGKSLLISTFASLFKHGLEHFSELAIEKLWKDKTYRVVEIDFSKVKGFQDFESFENKLRSVVTRSFAKEGFVLDENKESEWIDQISDWMDSLPGNSLVLLIDEYDAPHTACLENPELFEKVRGLLASFYAIVKSNDACFRFVFITGITKFNQTSIFSELNNFTDISLNPLFSSLLGYTEKDLEQCFSGYLKNAAEQLDLAPQEIQSRLKANYDGYCFDEAVSQHVYAPWSVLNFFSWPQLGFKNYWITSGGNLSLLQKHLHNHALRSPETYAEEIEVRCRDLDATTDLKDLNDVVLLIQTGYLTIKQRVGQSFLVGYPNNEVANSLAELYSEQLLRNKTLYAIGASRWEEAVNAGDVDLLFQQANHAFAAIDYHRYPISEEKHAQAFLQIFLAGAGFSVTAENHGALGRSDLEADAERCHWVFELKFQRKGADASTLLAQAIDQMKTHHYGAASRKPLVRAAAVFSEEKRTFVAWAQVA